MSHGVKSSNLFHLLFLLDYGGLQSWEPPCCRKIYSTVSYSIQEISGWKCVCRGSGTALELLTNHIFHGGLQSCQPPCCQKLYSTVSHFVQATSGRKYVQGSQAQPLFVFITIFIRDYRYTSLLCESLLCMLLLLNTNDSLQFWQLWLKSFESLEFLEAEKQSFNGDDGLLYETPWITQVFENVTDIYVCH